MGSGQFVSWDGGCLLIGPRRRSRRCTRTTPFRLRLDQRAASASDRRREPWTEYGGVIIASRQPHTMDSSHVPSAPCSSSSPRRAKVARSRSGSCTAALPRCRRKRSPMSCPRSSPRGGNRGVRSAIVHAAQRVVQALTGGVAASVVSDERILRATSYIKSHLSAPLTLEEVAEVAYLSPSRFRHLFVEETGTALRPYILWRRFVSVWDRLMAGESLSAAAHAAGFADAAHLTRTSRRMFGFPPSALQMAGPLRRDDDGSRGFPTRRKRRCSPRRRTPFDRARDKVSPYVQGASRFVQERTASHG